MADWSQLSRNLGVEWVRKYEYLYESYDKSDSQQFKIVLRNQLLLHYGVHFIDQTAFLD